MDTKTLLEWSAKYHTPNYGSRAPIVLVRGDGVRVWDSDGREYLDFGAGIAVTSLGHCHPRVTGAIQEAAATLLHVSNLYHAAPQIHLAKLLIEHSFADRVFFSNSGAEANEAALKLARKYARERIASDRFEFVATRNSFHGRTFATVAATGQEKYHHGFEPLPPGFKHVAYNDLRAMERAIDNRTAAVIVECIQGEGGVHVADEDYLRGLRKLCDQSGALLILDELGYLPIDKAGADLLFQVISLRYEQGALVITSNRACKEWPKIFHNDSTLTAAILDRLLHHAETVIIEGKSFRMSNYPGRLSVPMPSLFTAFLGKG